MVETADGENPFLLDAGGDWRDFRSCNVMVGEKLTNRCREFEDRQKDSLAFVLELSHRTQLLARYSVPHSCVYVFLLQLPLGFGSYVVTASEQLTPLPLSTTRSFSPGNRNRL